MAVSRAEIELHNSRASCWVIIKGQVYDLTDFIDKHPGGSGSILRYAGKDATREYEPIHPPGTIESSLSEDKHLGAVDPHDSHLQPSEQLKREPSEASDSLPPLATLQNVGEFRETAQKALSEKGWIYYSSAADSLSSDANNRADWSRIHFRPRILRRVDKISTSVNNMGHSSALPIFIAPAALAKLGHEDGELCLGRGAVMWDIPYCCSTYSSVSHADIAQCMETETSSRGALLFQLYVPVDKPGAKKLIQTAKKLKCKALVITVDSAVIGKREEDERYKARLEHEAGMEVARTVNPSPAVDAPVLRGAHTSTLDWDDLKWIKEEWAGAGPVVLKGIQTVDDAVLAAQAGVDGIYLSNHGGRQLDHAPSSIRTMLEIRRYCPELFDKLDVYVDGGVTRGSEVVKALCLGAKAVGLGRAFMYALSGYGTKGVDRAIEMLSDEIQTTMRLLGVTSIQQLSPAYVNASALYNELSRDVQLGTITMPSKL